MQFEIQLVEWTLSPLRVTDEIESTMWRMQLMQITHTAKHMHTHKHRHVRYLICTATPLCTCHIIQVLLTMRGWTRFRMWRLGDESRRGSCYLLMKRECGTQILSGLFLKLLKRYWTTAVGDEIQINAKRREKWGENKKVMSNLIGIQIMRWRDENLHPFTLGETILLQ